MEQITTTVATTEAPITEAPQARASGRGLRRTIATLFLATGLLAVGGVAAVSAASPAPSAPSAPAAGGTTTPAPHTGGNGVNCPGM